MNIHTPRSNKLNAQRTELTASVSTEPLDVMNVIFATVLEEDGGALEWPVMQRRLTS